MSRRWPVRYHVPRRRSPWPAVVAGAAALAVLVPAQVAVVTAAVREAGGPAATTAGSVGPAGPAGRAPSPGQSTAVPPAPVAPAPDPAPTPGQDAVAPALVVAFDTGGVDVAADDVERLELLAEEVRDDGSVRLVVTGRAEPSGDAVLEEQLSLARAEAVAAVLVGAGLAPQRVVPVAAGAEDDGTAGPGARAEVTRVVSDR